MTNAEKFEEIFGNDLHRDCITKSWWEQEFEEPDTCDACLTPCIMYEKGMRGCKSMTREEATEILKELWRYEKTGKYTDSQIREAIELAIEALSQPEQKMGQWKWKQYDIVFPEIGNYHCSSCNAVGKNGDNYCSVCGAKMREVEE